LYLLARQQKRPELGLQNSFSPRARMEEWEKFFRGVTGAPKNFPRDNGIEADYSKSVLELWEEVMSWPNLWGDFDLLDFSQLVQEVLGVAPRKHILRFLKTTATTNDGPSHTMKLGSTDGSSKREQPSQKSLGKQKAGISDNLADPKTRCLYYTGGICRSAILFLGPQYTSHDASLKLLRQWIKLYFHPTKKLENTGELPPELTNGITQAGNDLHRIIPIYSSQAYAKLGEWVFTSHLKEELEITKEVSSGLSSMQNNQEELRLNPEKLLSSPKSSPGLAKLPPSEQPRRFISNHGQIGLAPHSAEEGDLICQFRNCDVVALARKLESSEENCGLVGRAVLMPRWDERSDNSILSKVRYSIPDNMLWVNQSSKESPELADKERISLYMDIRALWELTQ
jgi:hypothetical protein